MYVLVVASLLRSLFTGARHTRIKSYGLFTPESVSREFLTFRSMKSILFSTMITIDMPINVKNIIERLEAAGYEAYAVGGCVRDSLLGRAPKDWDITTNATPLQVKELFRRTVDTGILHGTVTVMIDSEGYEVTTYRIDGKYTDGRHPNDVTFTPDLKEDLLRRDFTINAMAYNDKNGLVDMYGGQQDLENGIIRCVGDPIQRFSEDALRMMRAIRFSAQLGFEIDGATIRAIKKLASTLTKISAERIYAEMLKTITSDNPTCFVRYYETGLSKYFLPEFDAMMECEQNNPHHCYTVGNHVLKVLDNVRPEPIMRLSALLHDVAKPACKTTDDKGINHFKTHPDVGAKMSVDILRRLKSDNDTIDRVKRLVRWHDIRPIETIKSVRKAVWRVGPDLVDDLLELKYADVMAQSEYEREDKLHQIEYFRSFYNEIMEKAECLSLADLEIKGADLMTFGIERGPRIGELLNECLEMVLDSPEKNHKDILLKYVEEKIGK